MRQAPIPAEHGDSAQAGELTRANEAPLFSAVLTPHRSLGRTGFILLMMVVSASGFFTGILFMRLGAWPIAIFMALDILAIWLAFKLNYHSARQYETVEIWRDRLRIAKIAPGGKVREYLFPLFGAKFNVDRHHEYGILRMALIDHERSLDIGAFLNPDDRESFATAFAQALSRAKHY